jgi:hypothetical protein
MKAPRSIPVSPRSVLLFVAAAATLAACGKGPSKQELEMTSAVRADSIASLRNELLEQVMEGTRFVNEINKEISKARSLSVPSRELQSKAELVDMNEERKQVVTRINQLVSRLDQVQSRLSNARSQLAEKDSSLAAKVAAYEQSVTEATQAAEQQRTAFQTVIDSQSVKIATLTSQVDTLTGRVGHLTTEQNTVYSVVGTRQELMSKGVLVAEGPKRFGFAGSRAIAPARELDPTDFNKIDRRSDTTIVLPAGEYKIVSRQSTAFATPEVVKKGGKIAGTLKIEQPERFWSSSRYLIIVRS